MEFYASCPEGFESALADELKRLGLSHVRRLKGRATFEGELEEGYRACLWSHLASRLRHRLGDHHPPRRHHRHHRPRRDRAAAQHALLGPARQRRAVRPSGRDHGPSRRRRCRRPRCSPVAFAASAPREHQPGPFGRPAVQASAARCDSCRRGRTRVAPRLRRPGAGAGRLDRTMRARADGRRLRKRSPSHADRCLVRRRRSAAGGREHSDRPRPGRRTRALGL